MNKKNRGAIEIMGEILNAIIEGNNYRTAIMYKANLSYEQLINHTEYMREKGLIEITNYVNGNNQKRLSYRITSNGGEFLKHHRILLELMQI